jgi:glutamate-ammonia-ligase adenylyltransferase
VPKSLIDSPLWKAALKAAPDPRRARDFLVQLSGVASQELNGLTPERARILLALLSGSVAVSEWLIKHPEWLGMLHPELLQNSRREQGLRREVNEWLEPALQEGSYAEALAKLRLFHRRELVRLAARDLSRLALTSELTLELSNLADVCLGTVLRICLQQHVQRLGRAYHQNSEEEWLPTQFAILGLGKLGGQELNYNSDVDLSFIYSEEGHVFKEPPSRKAIVDRTLTNHQFFKRVAEAFVAEVTRSTADGMLYRVDLRLRPEGDAGPIVRSLPSYEVFYSQWGQTWERMMLMKARGVAGDSALVNEFLEVIQPFRYPRSLPEGALREIAAMKLRMENEVVKAGELERNVKLGRGGIREIEFVVQATQLLHGGRMPFLQGRQTLPALQKMVQYHLLEEDNARALEQAYCFLRDVEHRLQMENNLQTHTIPAQASARERLARLMEFNSLKPFEAALRRHTDKVRELYGRFLPTEEEAPASHLPETFEGTENEWKGILSRHSFKNLEQAVRLLKEFTHGPGYVHVSHRTVDLARQLIPKILALCAKDDQSGAPAKKMKTLRKGRDGVSAAPSPGGEGQGEAGLNSKILSDPDRVLARLDSFITAYGARAVLFETWNSNPPLFELMLLLFDRSEFLAEMAIRTPDLVDELVLSGRLRRTKRANEILAELRHGASDADQRLWIRRYHQAEFMRIGLRDILGLADADQNMIELSALADACLQYALEVVLRRQKFRSSPVAIIGLGKLGGEELNYGSDLDILFVAQDSTKEISKLQRIATDLMELLSSQTELGVAFAIDARLRPDGEKGLLVNTRAAYEDYYRKRAQLWEIQALTRVRSVAGDATLGGQFCGMAQALTDFRSAQVNLEFSIRGETPPTGTRVGKVPKPQKPKRQVAAVSSGLAAWSSDWKRQIDHMRQRIEKERTPPGQAELAIKTGAGGLIDVEFIAQALSLEHGWLEPNTLRALESAMKAHTLPASNMVKLIDNFRQLRRIESILRRWSFEGEAVLPVEPAPFCRVAVRCGFSDPEEFRKAVARYRKAIREVYQLVFHG